MAQLINTAASAQLTLSFLFLAFTEILFTALEKDIKDSLIQNETRLSDESHVHV